MYTNVKLQSLLNNYQHLLFIQAYLNEENQIKLNFTKSVLLFTLS